jgi:hypothetical protein
MTDNPHARPTHDPGKEIIVSDASRASVIYFDAVPTFGLNNDGIVNLMLAVYLILPTSDGGTLTEPVVAAHLRCNIAAAMHLRNAIDKVLLMAAPAPEGKAN